MQDIQIHWFIHHLIVCHIQLTTENTSIVSTEGDVRIQHSQAYISFIHKCILIYSEIRIGFTFNLIIYYICFLIWYFVLGTISTCLKDITFYKETFARCLQRYFVKRSFCDTLCSFYKKDYTVSRWSSMKEHLRFSYVTHSSNSNRTVHLNKTLSKE